MVICFEWQRAAVDQRRNGGLPMTGENTGLGALASPLVGYLGKVHERAAALEHCPWCTSKGLVFALRSYRINLQESITLCTNPQCLFPLVSQPLENVLESLVPLENKDGKKTKPPSEPESEEQVNTKSPRAIDLDSLCPKDSQVSNGEGPLTEPPEGKSPQEEDSVQEKKPENSASAPKSVAHVTLPGPLFWKNSHNLCWLDSLLVAFVNCKSLKRCKPNEEPQNPPVWNLIREYENICAEIQVHQETGKDGSVQVPNHALQKANADLQCLRMSIFELLKPQLHCRLGQKETPVFAMPLLLRKDSWAEPLFQATFQWDFTCSQCRAFSREVVVKTLPTFTNLAPDWHPLRASHCAPCSICRSKTQTRSMVLHKVSPVFALHFVQGLPSNDVKSYSFDFQGTRHSVTAVIQYKQRLEHFVAWIRQPDDSWTEFDDLQHPVCTTHRTLAVPGEEMHVVFWEAEEDREPACSPSSAPARCALSKAEEDVGLRDVSDEPMPWALDQSDIVSALSGADAAAAANGLDTSIGSTTLLNTFEGLSRDDIITLTLVEVPGDSAVPPEPPAPVQSGRNGEVNHHCAPSGNGTSPAPPELPSSSHSPTTEARDPTPVANGSGRRRSDRTGSGEQAAKKSRPQQAKAAAAQEGTPVENTQRTSLESTTRPGSAGRPPGSNPYARWSFMLSKHPHTQVKSPVPQPEPARLAQNKPLPTSQSTPHLTRRPQAPAALFPKPQIRIEDSEGLPLKAAERYDAFGVKRTTEPLSPACTGDKLKAFQAAPPASLTTLPTARAKALAEISASSKRGRPSSKAPAGLSDTDALRYKLLKKLKAKKKKLAKLNKLLGHLGGAESKPDSTDLWSPSTVTSSTFEGSNCDELLLDLLSPATTASNLSPDSSGFLEGTADRQGGGAPAVGSAQPAAPALDAPCTESFLEEFFSQAVAQQPTDMEMEVLCGLGLPF